MAKAFKLPDLGEGIHEGEVVSVLVKVGDRVEEEQPILVVETDKAAVEIPSPFSGLVQQINVKPGDLVQVGDEMIIFGDDGAAPDEMPAPKPHKAEVVKLLEPSSPPAPPKAAEPAPERIGPVPASPSTRRLARELGVDLAVVPGSGAAGLVTAEDVRAFAARGEEAPAPAEPAPAPQPEAPAGAAVPVSTVLRPSAVPVPDLPDFGRWGPVERVPLRSVRRATAKHMALAWSQVPHVNHQDWADITELNAFRRQHKAAVEAQGGKLTMTVFILKAVVAALKKYPQFNVSLDPDREEIVYKKYYHLGVAADTERGLVVPVLRDVDSKSITQLALELTDLVNRTREGKATLDELQGGTFTLTNIGALGGTSFAPIVNYPEVAILGIGKAQLQPTVLGTLDDYQIVPRLKMPLVLAFDHRVLDGAEAARFVNVVIELLESPDKLLLAI